MAAVASRWSRERGREPWSSCAGSIQSLPPLCAFSCYVVCYIVAFAGLVFASLGKKFPFSPSPVLEAFTGKSFPRFFVVSFFLLNCFGLVFYFGLESRWEPPWAREKPNQHEKGHHNQSASPAVRRRPMPEVQQVPICSTQAAAWTLFFFPFPETKGPAVILPPPSPHLAASPKMPLGIFDFFCGWVCVEGQVLKV